MEPATESCEECSRWKEIKHRLKIANLLESVIGDIEKRIQEKDLRPTVTEYLKLLQMEQDLEQESPREIKVTWVELATISNGEK
jgi:hypothetical protein